ncbi:Mitochondrial carrier protein ymc2, partial [Cladochytrium tenue]
FAAYESAKRLLAARSTAGAAPKRLSATDLFAAGAFSGLANSVLSGPIEHVRIRLQVQSGGSASSAAAAAAGGASQVAPYAGPWDFVRRVVRGHGLAGLYKGQGITLVREASGYGIYFLTYESLVQRQMRAQGTTKRQDIAAWRLCLYGALSGYTLWLVIYPIDVVKSKIQTDSLDRASRQFTSSLDCFRKVWAREGTAGLYRGFGTCLLRAGPANAVTFVTYEAAMNFLGR